MNRYAVTLGVQYRHEPHPSLPPEYSDPDGYLLVRAADEPSARGMVQAVIGTHYSFIYPESEVAGSRFHTKGCLGEIVCGVMAPEVSAALAVNTVLARDES